MNAILIAVAISCAIYVAYSIKGWNRIKTLREFFLINGKLERPGFWSTMVATNTAVANGFFLYIMLGFYLGWGAFFWSSIFWVVGLAIFQLFIKKLVPEFSNLVTLNEFLGLKSMKFGLYARRFAAIVTILSFLFTLCMELVIGSEVIFAIVRANTGMQAVVPDWVKIAVPTLMSLVLAVYLAANGFEAVRRTDFIQVFVFVPGVVLLGYIVLPKIASSLTTVSANEFFLLPKNWSFVVFSLFSWGFWFLVAMDMWVRCAAAGKAKPTSTPIWWSLIVLIPFTGIAVACGIYVKVFAQNPYIPKPGDFFLELLINNTGISIVTLSVIFVALVAAILSSVDTFIMVVAHSFFNDVLYAKDDYKKESPSEKSRLGNVRLFLLIMPIFCAVGFSYVVYVAKSNILSMNYMSYSLPLCLLTPVLIGLIKGKISGFGVVAASLLGILAVAGFTIPITVKIGNGIDVAKNYDLLYATPAISGLAGLIGYGIGKMVEPYIKNAGGMA